jgi:hypothetical protein
MFHLRMNMRINKLNGLDPYWSIRVKVYPLGWLGYYGSAQASCDYQNSWMGHMEKIKMKSPVRLG